tara:strand:+ start:108 stop:266 length:159 start_codon:yes stop_codon:yes gene_type:complete
MRAITKSIDAAFDRLKLTGKTRQWAWFVTLWSGSLACVLMLGYTIKFFMGMI